MALLLLVGCATPNPARFQIVAAPLTTNSDQGVQLQASTFIKLDTHTGQTWELIALNIQSRSITGWNQIKTFQPGEPIISAAEFKALQERTGSATPPTASKVAAP